jgi:hypothetical protein
MDGAARSSDSRAVEPRVRSDRGWRGLVAGLVPTGVACLADSGATEAGLRIVRRAAGCHPGSDLGPAGELEPVLDALDVAGDGGWRQAEPATDGGVLQAIGHEQSNLALTRGQASDGWIGSHDPQ